MQTTNQSILLTKEDHDHILFYLRNNNWRNPADRRSALQLQEELKRACLLGNDELPDNVVRLGSRVKVRELETGRLLELTIVTPDKANRKEQKISVFSPVGTALIGYSSGASIQWKVPAGERSFLIEEVEG